MRTGGKFQVDPRYGVDERLLAACGWEEVFGRPGPLVVEVGFGNGQLLVDMATARPEANFVGIELYGKGIHKLGKRCDREGIGNLRLIKGEALSVLEDCFRTGEIAEMHIHCPDPWPKLRHHKRRLVGPRLCALLFDRVMPGGSLYVSTDHDCYAEQMRRVLEAHPGLKNRAGFNTFIYDVPDRAPTKYERKFAAQGATIRHLHFDRVP